MREPTKIAVLVSGGGTNLQALLDAEKDGLLVSGKITLVVSNKEGAYALERAKNAGVETATVLKSVCGSQEAFEDALLALLQEKGIELILIKAPTNDWRYHWYDEWDAQICDYAEQNGLAYYNFIPLCEEIGIDWETDTYDVGVHLNVYGAEKLTSYLGRLLVE